MKEKNELAILNNSASNTEVALQQILTSKTSPALSEIKRHKGEQAALSVLITLMDECQQYFNLQQPMAPQQLMLTAELIMEEYYYLRVDEFKVCFRMAMKGEFGPVYNRIDGQIFFEWIRKFFSKRDAVTTRMVKDQQSSNNIYEMFQHPQVMEAMQQAADKLSIKEEPAREVKRENPPAIEIALMREYDALPTWDNDMRFRVYKNKPYQFTEYRKERYRELIETQSEY
jgi:hypothetical protein